jgi:translation initiation factor eIF-2B subunit gamma
MGSPSPTRPNDPNELYPSATSSSREWNCRIIVHAPPPPPEPVTTKSGKPDKSKPVAEAEHLIRANSLAGYWEMNRRLIRSLPTGPGSTPRIAQSEEGAVSASAQISPDSIIGQGTRVGERASIKKCVVGRHCVIGRGAKLTGCVLWDFVVVEEK